MLSQDGLKSLIKELEARNRATTEASEEQQLLIDAKDDQISRLIRDRNDVTDDSAKKEQQWALEMNELREKFPVGHQMVEQALTATVNALQTQLAAAQTEVTTSQAELTALRAEFATEVGGKATIVESLQTEVSALQQQLTTVKNELLLSSEALAAAKSSNNSRYSPVYLSLLIMSSPTNITLFALFPTQQPQPPPRQSPQPPSTTATVTTIFRHCKPPLPPYKPNYPP